MISCFAQLQSSDLRECRPSSTTDFALEAFFSLSAPAKANINPVGMLFGKVLVRHAMNTISAQISGAMRSGRVAAFDSRLLESTTVASTCVVYGHSELTSVSPPSSYLCE